MGNGDDNTSSVGSSGSSFDWLQYLQDISGDTPPDRDPNLPLDASVDISIDAVLPHRGADGVNPVFVDRYTSLERLGGQFAPRGGPIHAEIPIRMNDGVLDLSGNLLRFGDASGNDRFNFFDVAGSCVSGNLLRADGTLFAADSVRLTDDGIPRMYGTALGIAPFDDELRIVGEHPYVFPFGFNAGGELICRSEDRESVTDPFPFSSAIRDNNLPHAWAFSSILAVTEEMNRGMSVGGCAPDPHFDFSNVPEWMMTDPLMMIRQAGIDGRITIDGNQLHLPPIQGNPPMTINLGDGANSIDINASYNNPELQALHNGSRDADELARLRYQREASARINANFDIVSVDLGGQEISLPVSGNLDVDGQLVGLFPTRNPQNLWAHVALNGQVTLNGDIVVPAIGGMPQIRIRRGEGNTELSVRNFTATLDHGVAELNGDINGSFDFSEIQVDDMTAPGPHAGTFNLHAGDQGVVAELSARMTLPREGYPIPLSVALDRGYLEVDGLRLTLDDNHVRIGYDGLPEHITGTVGGTIALRDVEGSVEGHSITSNASVTINDGSFTLNGDMLYANMSLAADVISSIDGNDSEIHLNSNLSVNDYGLCHMDYGDFTWREITIDQVGGNLSGSFGDLAIQAPEGSFGDPVSAAELDGEVIQPGIRIVADTDGLRFGRDATAHINTHVDGVQITTSAGTFEITGQLVGRLQLVNVSEDPNVPDFRPVVGSINFEVRDGSVAQIDSGHRTSMLRRGTLVITDNYEGHISVVAHARHPAASILESVGLSQVGTALGIPDTVSSRLNIPEIQIGPEGIGHMDISEHPDQIIGPGDNILDVVGPMSQAISYYDPETVDSLSIPSILFRLTGGGATLLAARGSAEITGLQSDEPEANYRFRIPLPDQQIHIEGGSIAVDAGNGRVRISGTNERMRIRIRPPAGFDVNFSQERDGITYEVAGRLTPTGEVRASLTLNMDDPMRPTLRLHEPSDPYTLGGNLTVTARNQAGEVIGSGEVSINSAYQVSGHMRNGRAHFTFDVPETVLAGQITQGFEAMDINVASGALLNIPIRGFHGEIDVDARNPSAPSMTSVWNLPSVGSGDDTPEIFIPRLEIGGFEGNEGLFENISVNFHQDPQGQQVRIDVSPSNGIRFETLPGDDGQARTVRLSFAVGESNNTILITGTSDSSARVDGSISPDGEIIVNVSDLRVSSEVDGHVRQPLQLDLNELNTLAQIPGLQVHYNPSTNQIRFTATPPQPTLPTPPQTMEEFFTWTQDQWRDYQTALGRETHMLQLSEANAAVQRATGRSIPPGRGDIYVNLTAPLDLTLTVDDNLISNLTRGLERVLDVRRALPAPPPCTAGTCSPVVLYDGQDPEGELFFIQTVEEGGTPSVHSDISGILQEALGIPRSDVDNYLRDLRIGVPDFIRTVRQSEGVSDHYSERDLRDLLHSYLSSPVSNGSFRQMEFRSLITIANVRRSIGHLLQAQDGQLPVHGHVFRDDAYHSGSPGDGNDMQYLSLLPVTPDQVVGIVSDAAQAGRWDHWVDETEGSGNQATGRLLLNYDYTITTETGRDGNIRVIHFHMTPNSESEMEAYTRSIRLVPVTNAVDPNTGQTVANGTLLIMDEHADFDGPDHELPFPRTRISTEPQIAWEGFLNGSLRAFEPPQSSITRFSTNRFAVTVGNLLEIARNPDVSEGDLRSSLDYDSTRAEQTSTVRRVDFIGLNETGDTLIIDETAQQADVRPFIVDRLGVESATFDRWMRPVTDGPNAGSRVIPLAELRTASGLDQQLGEQAFAALTRTIVKPPGEITDIADDFGSSTERYFLVLERLKNRGAALRGPEHYADIMVFEDERFHPNISQGSRRQGDTVDSFNIYHIPQNIQWHGQQMQLDIDEFIATIHHTEYYARTDPDNFSISEIVPHATLSDPSASPSLSSGTSVDTDRYYTRSQIGLPGGLELNYLISSIQHPISLEGVGRLCAWRLEPSPQLNDFLDNTGWWLIVPAEGGGHWLFRAGILNSRSSGSDNTGTVADTGRVGIVNFLEGLVSSTLEAQRTGNPTAWTSSAGRVIDYRVGEVPRIQ